jgi:hypothetical protein
VTTPEPYVLPPAAALLLIATLIVRRARRLGERPNAAAWLTFFALLLAIVPLALAATGDGSADVTRAIATLAASIALLLGASVVARTTMAESVRPLGIVELAIAAGAAGAVGTVLLTILRVENALTSDGATLEAWLAPGAFALLAGAIILRAQRSVDATWLARVALAIAAVAEIAAVVAQPGDDRSIIRLTATVGALSAVHAIAVIRQRTTLGTNTAWIAIALAGIAAVVGMIAGTVEHIEQVTTPIAIALLVSGGVTLARRRQDAGSWPHLAPGTALLLLPSLLATYLDAPVWRLVLLGAVGLLVIIVGTFLRLQAPFLIGIVVVITHALRTFAPQLRAVYELADWYIWAGIGGAIVMAIAIRYEHRLRDAKRIVHSIASLR